MSQLKYMLKGFGYDSVNDFLSTNFKIFYIPNYQLALTFTGVLGTIRMFSETYLGLDLLVLSVFVFLTYTKLRQRIILCKCGFAGIGVRLTQE